MHRGSALSASLALAAAAGLSGCGPELLRACAELFVRSQGCLAVRRFPNHCF